MRLLFFFIGMAVSCAPKHLPRPGASAATQGDLNWRPENIEVSCAAEGCPAQVGALLFAGQPLRNKIPLRRCTGFLVAPNLVMSSGHCDSLARRRGYFVSQRLNGKKEIRSIVAVPFKKFTPHSRGPHVSSGRPDVALFELAQPIIGVTPLRLASGKQLNFKKLVAFAIAAGASEEQILIRRHECLVRRHESEFPFSISESPDVIQSFGCQLGAGTSGAPMFSPDSDEVQAVQMGEQMQSFEGHGRSLSTNVRCLDFPGHAGVPCLVVNDRLAAERFAKLQRSQLKDGPSRLVGENGSIIRLQATTFQLRPAAEMRFEVIHSPLCRSAAGALTTLPFVIEQLRIQFDPWANPQSQTLSEVTVEAVIKSISGNAFEVELTWPEAPEIYLQPSLDLRKRWGSRFHIDLPICPR